MKLYILRHGEATKPSDPKFANDAERPLTPKGIQRTKLLAYTLRRMEISFDMIFSSPLVRARETAEALADLRDLARGIYPPLLADQGLPAALEAQARKSIVTTVVESDGIARYPQEIESAVYFCCLEALQNVAKYASASRARIRLAESDAGLVFEVSDDGLGFDPTAIGYGTGLQGMADRMDALGGSIDVRSSPGEGTTVTGRIPIPR